VYLFSSSCRFNGCFSDESGLVGSLKLEKCIKHKRSKLGNLLPTNLKNIHSKSLFKKKLKKLFLQSLE